MNAESETAAERHTILARGGEVALALQKALGIEGPLRRITVDARVGELATVRVERLLKDCTAALKDGSALRTLVEEFELVPRQSSGG